MEIISHTIFSAVAIIAVLLFTPCKCDTSIDSSLAIIVSDDTFLWSIPIDSSSKPSILWQSKAGIQTFDFFENKTIYFNEIGSLHINSLSESSKSLSQPVTWKPEALAVDYVTEKIYVIDSLAGKLNVFDLRSPYYGVAVSDLTKPYDIALDPRKGLMFIVEYATSILRGNMDGTNIQKIVESNVVSAIAISPGSNSAEDGRIFWANDYVSIESSDYNGQNRKIIVEISMNVISLAVLPAGVLFWARPPYWSNDGSMWTCQMVEGTCDKNKIQNVGLPNPKTIKVYTPPEKFQNPCQNDNGGCQHLCLLNDKGISCACNVGFELSTDLKTCKLVTDFILYTQGNFVRGRILDHKKEAFTDAILPILFTLDKPLKYKRAVDFHYDLPTGTFIFSEDMRYYFMNISHYKGQIYKDLVSYTAYRGIAIDWISSTMYYGVSNYYESGGDVTIEAVSLNRFKKPVDGTQSSIMKLKIAGHLWTVAVHPNRGMLYFTVYDSKKKASLICKMSVGQKENIGCFDNVSVNETTLAIDYDKDRIYWLTEDLTQVQHANLFGEDVKSFDVSSVVAYPKSLSVHGNFLYVSNLTSIWRLNKDTGRDAVKIAPRFDIDFSTSTISSAKIFGPSAQRPNPEHPCAFKNGGCQQFCFGIPESKEAGAKLKRSCGCKLSQSIQSDGISCF